MSDRVFARLGVSAAFLYVALAVLAIVLAWANGSPTYPIQRLAGLTVLMLVGSILASRRPRNTIGWLFLCASLAGAVAELCDGLETYEVVTAPGSILFPPIAYWLVGGWFSMGALTLLVFSVFVFPSGRLPSPRWRPIAASVGLFLLVVTVLLTVGPSADTRYPQIANPLFVPALVPVANAIAGAFFLYVFFLALALASLVARYRAGSVVEKQQLKWILLAAVVMVVALGISTIAPPLRDVAWFFALPALPTAVAIAILRYHLYDIDHLINRTLVYGATSGVIAVLFFAPVVGLQPILRPLTEGSELAVAGSTLVAFALFQPIRRRIQAAVDRRFDRSRYDAARTLDTLSDELRDEVDLERVEADLLSAVSTTMAPQHVSLWLRSR